MRWIEASLFKITGKFTDNGEERTDLVFADDWDDVLKQTQIICQRLDKIERVSLGSLRFRLLPSVFKQLDSKKNKRK